MVNDLGNTDDLELMPLGSSYTVRRDRLMNELIAKGRKAGIVVLYAPDGFGKTSVRLQYAQAVSYTHLIAPQTGTRFPLHLLNSKTYAPSIPKLGRRKPKRNRRRSI